jgi:C4-dicarboxylate-specific signal transduction histidine kinase
MGVIVAVQFVPFASLTVFELQALLIALAVTGLFLGVIVDERRQAADELRESLRLAAAGEMSAALAHELNQPLTALTNYARAGVLMAQQPGSDPTQIRETLEKITVEASRAADVVRRLRDFFRTGSTSLRAESVEDVIASGIRAAQSAADAAGVRLERVIAAEMPKVLIDRLQIELVVKNLIANAIQALTGVNDPRLVRLIAERIPGDVVRITIVDSGPGVPADAREKVFEPFWSSRATGMGMGLAISRAIVEAHGGRLWTETGSSGTFVFTLPLAHG